jgi:hypothetical protein
VSLGRYAALVVGIAVSVLGLAGLVTLGSLEASGRWAVFYGATLAVLNTVTAHSLVLWAERRPTRAFLTAILGGMLGRMLIMLLAVVAGVLLLDLPTIPLALSLLFFFVLFLVMEITILHRRPTPAREAGR